MAGLVIQLEPGQVVPAKDHFDGSWREFARVVVPEGTRRVYTAREAEYSIFVLRGVGAAYIGSREHPLDQGSALTVGFRASVEIEPIDGEMELFVTVLNIEPVALGGQ